MSSDMSLNTSNIDINSMSDADKKEMQQFVENETQKASIQGSIHSLTRLCFKKCVGNRISSGSLDRYEEPCMQNCVLRFMDAHMATLRHLEKMRTAG